MNSSSVATVPQVSQASLANQRTYWACSFAITTVALLSLGYLYLESKRNKAFRTPIVQCFTILILGDFIFTLCYLPYHSYNTINSLLGGEFIDPGKSPICLVTWFLAAAAVNFELWGFVFLGYVPYTMIMASSKLRRRKAINARSYFFVIALAMGTNCIWFFVGYEQDQLGSNRGLYCAASTWYGFQSSFIFFLIAFTMSLFGMYFWFTYKRVKAVEAASKVNSDHPGSSSLADEESKKTKYGKSGTRAILKFGMFMFVNFCCAYGLFTISTLWNALSHQFGSFPPIELEMAAGMGAKLKAIADVITIFNIPAVQKERRKRNKRRNAHKVGIGPSSASSSELDLSY